MTTETAHQERIDYPTFIVGVRHFNGRTEKHHLGAGTTLHTLEDFRKFVQSELPSARTILIRVQ